MTMHTYDSEGLCRIQSILYTHNDEEQTLKENIDVDTIEMRFGEFYSFIVLIRKKLVNVILQTV